MEQDPKIEFIELYIKIMFKNKATSCNIDLQKTPNVTIYLDSSTLIEYLTTSRLAYLYYMKFTRDYEETLVSFHSEITPTQEMLAVMREEML